MNVGTSHTYLKPTNENLSFQNIEILDEKYMKQNDKINLVRNYTHF